MIGFYILFGLIFISIILSTVLYKKHFTGWADFEIIILTVLLLVSGELCYSSYRRSSDKILFNYTCLKNKLEIINSFPDSIQKSIYTYFPEFTEEIDKINNDIRINKENVNNPINGWLFSEDVANLEELKLNKNEN